MGQGRRSQHTKVHSVVNWKRRTNNLIGLEGEGRWVDQPMEVNKEAKKFFHKRFKDERWDAPALDGISFQTISTLDNEMLCVYFGRQ